MKEMTSLERATTMIAGRIPDRVPTNLHNFLMAAHMAGMPLSQCLQDGRQLAESQLVAWRSFHHDILLVENGTTAMAQAIGCGIHYSDEVAPRIVAPVLKRLEDVDKLRMPDPEKDHPLPEMLKCMKILRAELGDKVFIFGRADQGPLSLAAGLMGYEKFFTLFSDPEYAAGIDKLLDFTIAATTRYALALRSAGAHGTTLGEFGSDFISPAAYRRFPFPRLKRFYKAMRDVDFPATLHQCGKTTAVLPEMVESGAALLELDVLTDMHAAKQHTHGKAAVLGMVDPANVLHRGNPALVEQRSREAIEVLAPGGGFTIGPGCALMPDTPRENVAALIESAIKYGRYRPDGTLAS